MSRRSGHSRSTARSSDTRRTAVRTRAGAPSWTGKETEAYLIARDVLRRMRRTASLFPASSDQ